MEIFSYSLLEEQTFNDVTWFLGEPKWTRKQIAGFLFRGQEENSYTCLPLWKVKQRYTESSSVLAMQLGWNSSSLSSGNY